MNRNQKIVVSITGIFLVLMILVGLTYAYFLTKITGNTNSKSISVTTANLAIVYEDNSAEILGKDLTLIPSDTEIGTKIFTVTNNGNDTNYVVVIENVSVTKASDGSTTPFDRNDFRYTLTCTKSDGSSCDGVSTQSIFPINGGVLVGNSIKEGDVHTYTFKMWYIDTGIDQSNDMGKTIQARLNIANLSSMTNPYLANTNSLAYNIIENAKSKANGTELLSSPKTQVATAISSKRNTGKFEEQELDMSKQSSWYYGSTYGDAQLWNGGSSSGSVSECSDTIVGKYISYPTVGESWYVKSCKSSTVAITVVEVYDYEKNISVATDDYGTSYYYRGNVIDNYVNFAGMCWRAVRIVGDGSIKLILEDQDNTCVTSDGNWNIPTTTGGTTKSGNFGYTQYAAKKLTASDGTQNSSVRILMNYLNGETNNIKSMAFAFRNFQTGPLVNYLYYLKSGDWCLNDKGYATSNDDTKPLTSQEILDKQIKGTTYYYDSAVRLEGKTIKKPTLKCNGTNMSKFADNIDMYVGTLTTDEVVYAGGTTYGSNKYYYLINDYQKTNDLYFWSLSLSEFNDYSYRDSAFIVGYNGRLEDYYVSDDNNIGSFRSTISLKSGIKTTSGNGTITNPYILE